MEFKEIKKLYQTDKNNLEFLSKEELTTILCNILNPNPLTYDLDLAIALVKKLDLEKDLATKELCDSNKILGIILFTLNLNFEMLHQRLGYYFYRGEDLTQKLRNNLSNIEICPSIEFMNKIYKQDRELFLTILEKKRLPNLFCVKERYKRIIKPVYQTLTEEEIKRISEGANGLLYRAYWDTKLSITEEIIEHNKYDLFLCTPSQIFEVYNLIPNEDMRINVLTFFLQNREPKYFCETAEYYLANMLLKASDIIALLCTFGTSNSISAVKKFILEDKNAIQYKLLIDILIRKFNLPITLDIARLYGYKPRYGVLSNELIQYYRNPKCPIDKLPYHIIKQIYSNNEELFNNLKRIEDIGNCFKVLVDKATNKDQLRKLKEVANYLISDKFIEKAIEFGETSLMYYFNHHNCCNNFVCRITEQNKEYFKEILETLSDKGTVADLLYILRVCGCQFNKEEIKKYFYRVPSKYLGLYLTKEEIVNLKEINSIG